MILRFFFLCSVFLLLATPLLGMEVRGRKEQKTPLPLSTQAETERGRREEQENQRISSLQEGDSSDSYERMERVHAHETEWPSTPTRGSKELPQGSTAAVPTGSPSGITEVVSPNKKLRTGPSFAEIASSSSSAPLAERNIVDVTPISREVFLKQVGDYQVQLKNCAEQIAEGISDIGRLFGAYDRQAVYPLFAARLKLTIATAILVKVNESPESSVPAARAGENETFSQEQLLPIRFKLGVLALRDALAEVNTTAEALVQQLVQHPKYGTAVDGKVAALKQMQEEARAQALLDKTLSTLSSHIVDRDDSATITEKAELIEQQVTEAKELLQKGRELTLRTDVEISPVSLALSIFAERDYNEEEGYADQLRARASEVTKKLLMLETALKAVQEQGGEERDLHFPLLALKIANKDAAVAIEELKESLSNVKGYKDSWGFDVKIILDKIGEPQSDTEDSTD